MRTESSFPFPQLIRHRRTPGWLAVLPALLAFAPILSPAREAAPNHPRQPSGEFLTRWLLCGPFTSPDKASAMAGQSVWSGLDVDFLASAGGESAARPLPGQSVTNENGSAIWKLHETAGDVISLDAAVSTRAGVVAYAYCTVECDGDQNAVLAVGSNDGARVWINGEEVWKHAVGRTLSKDEDRIPVRLKAGRNAVLLKIEELDGTWAFCCRFLRFDAARLSPDTRLFRITSSATHPPLLTFAGQQAVAGPLLQNADVSAFAASAPETAVWTAKWTGGELPVAVDVSRFGEYVLRINMHFATGGRLATTLPFTAGKRVEHTLFSGGKTEYTIVLGADASDSEQWVAHELQHWLKEISGAEFPIIRLDAASSGSADRRLPGREIVLGDNSRARELLGAQFKPMPEADEGFSYENAGPAVLIRGGRQRGTMYGVMAFLENELGARWYTPRVTVTPRRDGWSFVNLKRAEQPRLRVRNDFYFEAFDPVWAARNRINGAMNWRGQKGGLECYWGVHTFFPLLPPSVHFEKHPEYYSLIDGRRAFERAQLCLSNPDVLRLVTESLRKVIRENPDYRIYDVSQNDWHGPCQCGPCQKIARREASESGPVIWFVNQVAEAIEKEFPDKFIGTLAYQYTRKPPANIRPRHNVVVRLCSIECCFAHPLTGCPENKSFVADMKGWASVAPSIYIWDYVVNFSYYTMPYPNFRVLQPNLIFFRDHHAIGVMEQAAYQSRGGEFAELRAYLIARLLWNPQCDTNAVIDDFLSGYYGRSGPWVRRYFDLLHTRLTPDTHIGLGTRPTDRLYADPFLREAGALFDQAEIVADTDAVRQRVELARLPVMFLKCKRNPKVAREDGTYARLRAIMNRENVTLLSEGGAPHMLEFFKEMETTR